MRMIIPVEIFFAGWEAEGDFGWDEEVDGKITKYKMRKIKRIILRNKKCEKKEKCEIRKKMLAQEH